MIAQNFEEYIRRKETKLNEAEASTRKNIIIAQRIYANIEHLRRTSPLDDLKERPIGRDIDIVKKLEALNKEAWQKYWIEKNQSHYSEVEKISTYVRTVMLDLERRNVKEDFYRFIMETPYGELLIKLSYKSDDDERILPEAWLRQTASQIGKTFKQFLKKEIKSKNTEYSIKIILGEYLK